MCNYKFQNFPIPAPPSQTTHDPDRSVHTGASHEMQTIIIKQKTMIFSPS